MNISRKSINFPLKKICIWYVVKSFLLMWMMCRTNEWCRLKGFTNSSLLLLGSYHVVDENSIWWWFLDVDIWNSCCLFVYFFIRNLSVPRNIYSWNAFGVFIICFNIEFGEYASEIVLKYDFLYLWFLIKYFYIEY